MSSGGTEIKILSDDSVRRIVAEQAITDLSSIVKELVDNALDAESNTIKIRLFGQGLDIVEVSDDGSGVPPESRPYLAERYATSKITNFEDIYSGTGLTMGFRGEALFSMACLCDKLVVATRTEDEEMAQKLEYGKDGKLNKSSVEQIHRKIGTTVAVISPFAALPARRINMTRRIQAERTKLFKLMEAYAIFNVGVQINLIDIKPSGIENVALATSSTSRTLHENVSSVIGHTFLRTLSEFQVSFESLLNRDEGNMYNWGIDGLISKDPQGEMPCRVINYFCINGRVVELPKVVSVLRRVWNGFGGKKKPSCVICLTLPNDEFDINLSPDKQHVLLSHEEKICQIIEEEIIKLWSKNTQGVFKLRELETPIEDTDQNTPAEDQKHKRRYAFVHDIGSAKMQHQSEERYHQNNDDDLRHRQAIDNLEASRENDIVADEEDCRSKKRLKSATLDGKKIENIVSDKHSGHSSNDSLPCLDKISDMERRKWSDMQSRFNSHKKDDLASIASPLTPSEVRVSIQVSRRVSKPLEETKEALQQQTNPFESSQLKKQLSLKDFAFDVIDSSQRSNEVRIPPLGENDDTGKTQKTDIMDRKAPTKSRNINATVSSIGRSKEEGGSETSIASNENESQIDSDASCNQIALSPQKAADSSDSSNPTPSVKPRVAWKKFVNTQNVCKTTEIERLAMIKRMDSIRMTHQHIREDHVPCNENNLESISPGDSPRTPRVNLSKDQFRKEMEIIGQFNMGFILVKCKMNHLWILDQHACDEKYNFEDLCRNTKIHEQKLLKPMHLDLSPAEEACIIDNMHIFEGNGFRFNFDSTAPIRKRLSLTSLPHSGARDGRKAVQFNKDDVVTLCAILMDGSSYDGGDGGTGTDGSGRFGNNAVRRYASTAGTQSDTSERIIARLPKAIAMFASRACRSSIMIGTALSQKQMETIVTRLADVDHPWNCPHGRPTMRHVGDIQSYFKRDNEKAAEYISDAC